jgi:hypothetical protein
MKNIKNTIAAAMMMAVLGLGATTANAYILVMDRSASDAATVCTKTEANVFDQLTGILIVGFASTAPGLMLSDRAGLMLSDRSAAPCTK